MKGVASRKRHRDEHGAAALEFALIFIPFVVLVMGLVQFAFYFWTAETTNSAARETARRIVVGDCWDDYGSFATDHGPRVTTTTVTPPPAGLNVGDKITVTVTANASLGVLPFDFGLDDTVTRSYEARMEVDAASEEADDECAG